MKRLLCITVALLALAQISHGQTETVTLPDKAQAVKSGESISHTFAGTGDVLWLKVPAEAAGTLCYTARGWHKDRGTTVALFNAKGQRVGAGDPLWIGYYDSASFMQVWSARVQPGDHYARVTCTHGQGRFTIAMTVEPADQDDTPEQARPVEPGKSVHLRVVPAGDVDHLRFTVDKPGWAIVRRVGKYKQATIDTLSLSLLDATGKTVAAGKPVGGDTSGGVFWVAGVQPGQYTVAVTAEQPFTTMVELRVELLEGIDPLEPDDSAELARIVPLHRMLSVQLLPSEDTDWLRFKVPSAGVLTIHQPDGARDPMYLKPELFAAAGQTPVALRHWEHRAANVHTLDAARISAGQYLLKLSGAPLPASRRLQLQFQREDDACEPNDDPAQAVEGPGTFFIRPSVPGDVEWFALEADRPGSILTVTQYGTGRFRRYKGEVVLEDGSSFGLDFRLHSGDNAIARAVLPAGRHKVKLSSGTTQPELIRVEFKLTPGDVQDPYEPNDTREQACPIVPGETIRFRLMPGPSDADWFYFDAPEDGIATFRFVGSVWDPQISVLQPGQDQPAAVPWYSWDAGLSGTRRSFQRAVPVKKGRVHFVVTDRAKGFGDGFLDLQVRFMPPAPAQDANLFFIGFQTDASANSQIDALAAVSGGKAIAATKPEELVEAIKGVIAAAAAKRRPADEPVAATLERDWPMWKWVVALAVVVLAAAVLWRLRKRSA